MCVQSTMVERTCKMQIQPKGDLLAKKFFHWLLIYYHGNRTNWAQSYAKFDVHTHYHCQVIK